ncbi:MAG: hypothetical protein U0514_01975 [Candidatus Andersenbacteria bacterium]
MTNECREVGAVAFRESDKPPSTIEIGQQPRLPATETAGEVAPMELLAGRLLFLGNPQLRRDLLELEVVAAPALVDDELEQRHAHEEPVVRLLEVGRAWVLVDRLLDSQTRGSGA